MKMDTALVAALIAIGFFTSEVHAKNYILKLSESEKTRLMNIVKEPIKMSKKIERSQPSIGGRCG